MKQIYTHDNIQTAKAIYNYLIKIYKDRQIEWNPQTLHFLGDYEHIISNRGDVEEHGDQQQKKVASLLMKYFTFNNKKVKAEHWRLVFNNFRKKIEEDNDNELTERQLEGWLYMDDLKQMMNEMKDTKLNSLVHNIKFLLIAIHYYGALRSSYYYNLPINNKITGDKINYLYLPNIRKPAQYIVYDDKVSDTRSHATNTNIEINKELHKIFLESLKAFPRSILMPGIKDNLTFIRALKKATNSTTTSNQILRTAYETERYLDQAVIKNQYAKWAKDSYKLRHSPHAVFIHYIKSLHNMPRYREKLIDFYTNLKSIKPKKNKKAKVN